MRALNRDYDVTRGQYQALVERLNRANSPIRQRRPVCGAFRGRRTAHGKQPTDFPRPHPAHLVVLLGGLAAGIGVAYLMHQLRPVFVSARQLTELTQLPVLGVVSMTWLERHKAQARRAVQVYSMAVAVLIAVAAVTLLTQSATSHFLHG